MKLKAKHIVTKSYLFNNKTIINMNNIVLSVLILNKRTSFDDVYTRGLDTKAQHAPKVLVVA